MIEPVYGIKTPVRLDYTFAAGQATTRFLRNIARKRIEDITAEVEVGRIYEGTVLRLLDFGAIVQVLPGKDGLLHISQIAKERVNQVSDYVKEGQIVRVKVLEADDKGRLRLSMKAAAEEEAAKAAAQAPAATPSESTPAA